ncbi:hypothetical protein Tco_1292211 [Tanacetum coccineum]
MVKEGIVLGHKISKSGIEVDKSKVDVIAKLPHPTTVKGIRSFLVYAFEKFRPYLVLSKAIVVTNHSALKYRLAKADAKPRIAPVDLLIQEFDNGYSRKGQKESQKRQNQARDGKDKVKSKPKSKNTRVTLQKEEEAKQVHLDSLLVQRLAEEEELNEQHKKRRAQVQFEAQHYTDEDWDLIRAKIEANAELSKSMLGSDLQGEDFAKKMVDLGTWKLSQLKNLIFEEVKEEFDKLVKQVESFAPINFEATKDSLKRFELQTKTAKKLKFDDESTQPTEEKVEEDKDDKPTKKTGKRRKQIARKGLHTDLDKDDSEDSDEASEKDDSTSGTKIPINPVPVAIKSPSIANYKIIKQGRKGVYQIVRENGTDMVYISFGAMLTDISRDDLTELYRIVMRKHGMNEPEDEFEKVLWEYLKNMFEEPLSTDSIWSLPGQQRLICWRYYDACRVHCLNLESVDIYMLIERKYPLSAEVCKAMLDKKLQGGKPDEDCYKLLKMMEKQAGIRKHKDWLVQEQTALGKDFSNPLMADNLLKIVWLSTHHTWLVKSWLAHKFMDCGKGCAKGLTSLEQTATSKGVNTPGSDENSLKLYDLIADMKGC